MKSIVLSLLFLFAGVPALFAKDRMLSIYMVSDSVNPELSKTQSKFRFHVQTGIEESANFQVAVNGVWKNVTLDKDQFFEMNVQPGTYSFEILYNSEYEEVFLYDAKIKAQHEQCYNIFLYPVYKNEDIHVRKPVIYFHSGIEREVSLTVVPSDKFIFTYPESDGNWNGTVKPNQGIDVDGIIYPYLFWESDQKYAFNSEENGYKVEKADAISFLSKKLDELGFNQQEKTDFITFWGPQLAENESSFVQFAVDDDCIKFAEMTCSPSPDFSRRVYIQIAKWDPQFEIYLKDVSFSPIPESNWYILEWGGFTFELQTIGLTE